MADRFDFAGVVVRIEGDGFGVVRFDHPHSANTHGYFSATSVSTEIPVRVLKPGTHVSGTADSTSDQLAVVRSLQVDSAETGFSLQGANVRVSS